MRYLGGKYRHGREISNVLKKYAPPDKVKGYIEPFCGALGVCRYMTDDYRCYISDNHKDLILFWKAIKAGTFKYPKSISEQTYNKFKCSNEPSAMRAFVGFGLSFGGMWFTGYAEKYNHNCTRRNTLRETTESCKKIKDSVRKIKAIRCISYDKLKRPKEGGYLIYCDPPYQNTAGYKTKTKGTGEDFDHEKFWNIAREWSKNNIVIVSEFKAPKDFKCVWKSRRNITINNNKNKNKIEKLFMIKK